jgi:aminoglycoside phosphotransferase (APT) family kinase protein
VPEADEVEALSRALHELGVADDVDVLADHPGRRRVVRAGDAVVKAFASAEVDAWQREAAGLRAVAGSGVAVELVGEGERWTATRVLDGIVPMSTDVDEVAINRALGPALVALHAVPPVGLPQWSVVDRLRARLASPPPTCSASLAGAVATLVEPLLGAVTPPTCFVHGDWGTANVLVDPAAPTRILAIIDFEDAHAGDAAEDFKWQVLAGPASDQFTPMAATYAAEADLGPNAAERLVVAGAELCLDVLGWSLEGETGARFWGRCRQTLEELVDGTWPAWPT